MRYATHTRLCFYFYHTKRILCNVIICIMLFHILSGRTSLLLNVSFFWFLIIRTLEQSVMRVVVHTSQNACISQESLNEKFFRATELLVSNLNLQVWEEEWSLVTLESLGEHWHFLSVEFPLTFTLKIRVHVFWFDHMKTLQYMFVNWTKCYN